MPILPDLDKYLLFAILVECWHSCYL